MDELRDFDYCVSLFEQDDDTLLSPPDSKTSKIRKFVSDVATRMWSVGALQSRLHYLTREFESFLQAQDPTQELVLKLWPVSLQVETQFTASMNAEIIKMQRWSEGTYTCLLLNIPVYVWNIPISYQFLIFISSLDRSDVSHDFWHSYLADWCHELHIIRSHDVAISARCYQDGYNRLRWLSRGWVTWLDQLCLCAVQILTCLSDISAHRRWIWLSNYLSIN